MTLGRNSVSWGRLQTYIHKHLDSEQLSVGQTIVIFRAEIIPATHYQLSIGQPQVSSNVPNVSSNVKRIVLKLSLIDIPIYPEYDR